MLVELIAGNREGGGSQEGGYGLRSSRHLGWSSGWRSVQKIFVSKIRRVLAVFQESIARSCNEKTKVAEFSNDSKKTAMIVVEIFNVGEVSCIFWRIG